MIGHIEQAIIDKIQAASTSGALGYKPAKVASYGGEYSDPSVRQVIKDFPAVSVMFDGARSTKQTNGSVKIDVRYGVFVAARNLRSEKEARHGDGTNPGSYKMIEDMILLLTNQNFGLEIAELSFEDVSLVLVDKSDQGLVSVYGISFKTSYSIGTLPSETDIASLGTFQKFHANWDIPPHGNVSTDLPADSTADATDHVEKA